MTGSFRRACHWLVSLYPLLLVILLWEVAAWMELVQPVFLPSFSAVLVRAWQLIQSGELFEPLFVSLYRAAAGLVISLVVGVPLGFLMARWKLFNRILDPLVAIGYPAPKMAFIPIFILWFGIDHLSKILLVASNCVFPIIISAYAGARTMPVRQLWAAEAMGTPSIQLFTGVIFPATLPSLMSGLRISVPLALLTAFTAEMVAGGGGLGGALVLAQRFFESQTVYVYILTMLITGYIIDSAFLALRRHVLRWDESSVAAA